MRRTLLFLITGLGAAALGGCVYDGYGPGPGAHAPYGDYGYAGREWREPRHGPFEGDLHGPGVVALDPWLRETGEGREIVTLGFRDAGHGFVDMDIAHRANIWFRRYADHDRDMRLTDVEIRTALVAAVLPYRR